MFQFSLKNQNVHMQILVCIVNSYNDIILTLAVGS